MSTFTWDFGSAAAGLQFTIDFEDSTSEFTVTSLLGSFDLNALWFSDGNTTSDGYTLVKSDNSLNMNGNNTVWDDGASSNQKIVWDAYGKLSHPGLGSAGINKPSFISNGEAHSFSLSDFGLTTFDPTHYDTLGVRATSVNGNGEIKWADLAPQIEQGDHVCVVTALKNDTNTSVDEESSDIAGNACLVAYLSTRGGETDIYYKSTEGGPETQLALPGIQADLHMSGDPGDGSIVFTDELSQQVKLYDSSTVSLFTAPGTGGAQSHPDISEDGTHVVYTQASLAGSQIVEWDVGANTTFTLPGGTQRSNPSVSGDGSGIVFEDRGFSTTSEIVVYNTATNTTTRLTNNSVNDVNPSISNDGNYIAIQSDTSALNSDVLVFQQTSPGVWSALANVSSGLPTNGNEINPELSGDGRFVVFAGTVSGETDVFVWDRTTGEAATAISMAGEQRNAHISTDGQAISFESSDGAQFDVFTMPNPIYHDDVLV